MKRLVLGGLVTLALAAGPAGAEIYKYVDDEGRVTYTNVPRKGAKKLDIEVGSAPKSRSNPGPANFPRVDSQTQRARDDMRRKILQDELASEEKSLADARLALKEGEATRLPDEARNPQKYQDRIQRLRETVARHERNIAALKKELAGLR